MLECKIRLCPPLRRLSSAALPLLAALRCVRCPALRRPRRRLAARWCFSLSLRCLRRSLSAASSCLACAVLPLAALGRLPPPACWWLSLRAVCCRWGRGSGCVSLLALRPPPLVRRLGAVGCLAAAVLPCAASPPRRWRAAAGAGRWLAAPWRPWPLPSPSRPRRRCLAVCCLVVSRRVLPLARCGWCWSLVVCPLGALGRCAPSPSACLPVLLCVGPRLAACLLPLVLAGCLLGALGSPLRSAPCHSRFAF